MEKKHKRLLGIGIAIALGIVAWLIYKTRPQPISKVAKLTDLETGSAPNFSQPYQDVIDENKVLKKGDVGNNVKALQDAVNLKITELASSENKLTPDGVFGNATEYAIQGLTQGIYRSDKQNITIKGIKNYHA